MANWYACATQRDVGPRWIIACASAAMLVLILAGCGSPSGTSGTRGATPTSTVTSVPATYTPNPLTPTPTTEEQRLNALVWQTIGRGAVEVHTTYEPHTGATTVKVIYSAVVPIVGIVPTQAADIAAAQERVKVICFEVERALWTSGTTPLSQVNAAVLGPVLDQYANLTSQAYGSALLKAATEAHVNWGTLTPDQAWNAYDNTYLRPDYSDVD